MSTKPFIKLCKKRKFDRVLKSKNVSNGPGFAYNAAASEPSKAPVHSLSNGHVTSHVSLIFGITASRFLLRNPKFEILFPLFRPEKA